MLRMNWVIFTNTPPTRKLIILNLICWSDFLKFIINKFPSFFNNKDDYIRMYAVRQKNWMDKLDGHYYCGAQQQRIVVRNRFFEIGAITEYTPDEFRTITIKPPSDILRLAANQPFQLKVNKSEIPIRQITFY